jgi:hypothetical protein
MLRIIVSAVAAGTIALAIAPSAVAQGPASVYRCKQPNGSIAYQDFACSGGVPVDIKPDSPDPVTIDRLQRQQADFDRAYAQRRAEEAAERERQRVEQPRAPLPPRADNEFDSYQEPGYLFFSPAPRANFRDKRVMHHGPPKKPMVPSGNHRPHRLEPT